MPKGRPTKYNEEVLKKTQAYLDGAWELEDDVIPTIEGLAFYLDVSRETIYAWGKEESKKDFSDTVAKINALQKRTLINKGLDGKFNPNITKLVLGTHGISEKHQQEVTGANGGPQEHIWTVKLVDVDGKKK